MTAITFETMLLIPACRALLFADSLVLDCGQAILRGFRIGVLALMSGIFILTRQQPSKDMEADSCERQSLIHNEMAVNCGYGSLHAKVQEVRMSDAQHLNWFDYFSGFRLLFPYIWPSESLKQQGVAMVCLLLLIGQRIVNILVPYRLEILIASLGKGTVPYRDIALYVLLQGLQGHQGVIAAPGLCSF